MKTFTISSWIFFWLIPLSFFAQSTVSGVVSDAGNGQPIPGVNIIVKGTSNGTTSDFDGRYSITNVNQGDILTFSYVGFKPQEVVYAGNNTINVSLEVDAAELEQVVLIGYGTTRKKDLTGSVSTVTAEELNKGVTTSPADLLTGKAPGVQITSAGGAPGSAQTIRIRGGASLNASNKPLFIIDGVPIDNDDIAGLRDPLNIINPNDIESFTILKDASATAIYGSRASNGVILITTKKGTSGNDLRVNYESNISIQDVTQSIDVLSADQFRQVVNERGNPTQIGLLGTANTDWQDEIFQQSISHTHNISLSGGMENFTYRASVGYNNQEGVLLTSALERTTLSAALSHKFFENHLKINLNTKTALIKNRFADTGAIGAAIVFDPTQPVFGDFPQYDNFYQWTEANGSPITLAAKNPVAMLRQQDDSSNAFKSISNIQFDYKFHFLPELRANLNLGLDKTSSNGSKVRTQSYFSSYAFNTGLSAQDTYAQEKENKLLNATLNYTKEFNNLNFGVLVGYEYQDFHTEQIDFTNIQDPEIETLKDTFLNLNLQSYFTRVNLGYDSRYLFTFTYRRDGTSRFNEDNRWGNFPAAAVAWNISNESFLEDSSTVSDLKLRAGWGITGQQDLGTGFYLPYIPTYTGSNQNSQYPVGNGFVTTFRADPYNDNLKWEETTTYNIGLDYGFFNDRLSGSIDAYYRETEDLLITNLSFPAGSGLSNKGAANVGVIENKGVEFSLNAIPVQTDDLQLNIGFNITYFDTEISELYATQDPNFIGIPQGGIAGGTGNNIQIHSVGYTPFTYYVYQQVYDTNGDPIEGVFVDRNNDGQVNPDDLYRHEQPAAEIFAGLNTDLSYKNWGFNMAWRGSFGNYAYNNVQSNTGYYNNMLRYDNTLSNSVENVLESNFTSENFLSDYYIQDASFVKLDRVTLSYDFNNLFEKIRNVRLYATVQNVLTITDYDGLDPEIQGGIDNNIYPRPTIYLFGVNVDF
ncbi:SusC/RagA family TonB-linked outer membrane protein [Aquimarina intermedia]|uniref:Iron complex outermembrane receptor protein n=1 Tax=Aquimarina intermedia TaxID=350814 RepID=A0A5S5C1A3_9FLAO|nr:TonB-dependent receptor [Aquimarina intermedia]TYP72216.1 iron complex outermembrane receptor protein [Aquimarina intermedia]